MGRLLDEDTVIKVLECWKKAFRENSHYVSASDLSLVVKDVRELPPAQPEPHEGTWVYGEDFTADCVDGYRCSQCGFFVPWDYNHKLIDYINDYAYCPNCGAKMKGEQDGH